jgi:hypothetical protein
VAAPPPGANPADLLAIDPNGPSLRAVDARNLGGPPRGQVVAAGKPLAVPAGAIGQVFAIALDDASPPNIYAAATSAYGLPIVVADRNGDGAPDRVRQGAPGAAFMPGLFGPTPVSGPGTIWRIDGLTGQVSVFANVTLDGRPNSGAALGGLAFDPASRLMFVSDRESGVIHAFALDGREAARFDHGTEGFAALGLPAVPFDPTRRADIESPAFDSTDPATWNTASPVRRVFGLAVHRGRLYYAVAAGARIFSVELSPDGRFTGDVRLEYALPPSAAPGAEVSKIVFDDAGHMIVAERAPPTGAWDFGALTAEGAGRVLRLRAKPPGAGGTPYRWADAGEYAIGFPGEFRNGDGGVAIGNGYDAAGFVNFTACGGTLWTTGSQLRVADNPAFGERLAAGGPLPVDGLQGNGVTLVRPQNAPPFASYFIDFDDIAEQAGTPGHMGDVVSWRACPGPLYPLMTELLYEEAFCPIGTYFGRNQCLPSPCRPGEFYRAGHCERPECVPNRRDPLCCPPGTKWNPRTRSCEKPKRPDLTIKKEVLRCGSSGPCQFRLIVTNTGEVAYNGPIAVGDQVTPGQVNAIQPPSADWQCGPAGGGIFACTNPNATLPPGGTLVFTVSVTIPQTLRGGWKNCGAVAGDPKKESNWSNNKSCVEREGDKPTPTPQPNVTVAKTAPASCTRVSGTTYRCEFTISVTNSGGADHAGEVVVSDVATSGQLVSIGGGGWTCAGGTPLSVCRNPGGIRAGETQSFPATVEVTVGPDGGRASNCVSLGEIVRRGSLPSRTRIAASEWPGSLLLRLAQSQNQPPPGGGTNGPPSGQTPPPPPAPPPAQPGGRDGAQPPGSNGAPPSAQVCATVDIPPEATPTTGACPPGLVRTLRGGCCTPESIAAGTCGTPPPPPPTITCQPPAFVVNGVCCTREAFVAGLCGGTPLPTCPPGLRRGPDGNCFPGGGIIITDPVRCGVGQIRGPDGKCHDRPITCPRGLVWDGTKCTRPGGGTPSCKKGLVWDGTKCTRPGGSKPSCQKGFVWDGQRCVTAPKPTKPQCSTGFRWDGRRCVPPPKTTKPKPKPGIRQPPPATIKNPVKPLPGTSPPIRTPVTPVKPPQRPR